MRKYLRLLVCVLSLGITSSVASAQVPIVARAVTRAFVGERAAIGASRGALDYLAAGKAMYGITSQDRIAALNSTALGTTIFDTAPPWASEIADDIYVDPVIGMQVKQFCAEKPNTRAYNGASKDLAAALDKQASKRLARYSYLGLEHEDVTSEMMIKIVAHCLELSAMPDAKLRAYVW